MSKQPVLIYKGPVMIYKDTSDPTSAASVFISDYTSFKSVGTKSRSSLSSKRAAQDVIISNAAPMKEPTSFKKIKDLGQGSYGVVSMIQGNDGKEYAQKVMSLDDSSVLNEVDLALRLIHPNIIRAVRVKAYTEKEGRYDSHNVRLTLELADSDMNTWLQKQAYIVPLHIVKIMHQLLSAVHFLHQQGYYHCDIKPHNILMFGDLPKIADLGLSFPFEHPSQNCGTLGWISPQALDVNIVLTNEDINYVQADIFSLGVVLFKLVTGDSMFDYGDGDIITAYELFENRVEYARDAAERQKEENKARLLTLVSKMTALSQSDRLQTIQQALDELSYWGTEYTIPIPGVVKATNMINHCSTVNNLTFTSFVSRLYSMYANSYEFAGNGLCMMISITLLARVLPLLHNQPDQEENDILDAIVYISCKYLEVIYISPGSDTWAQIINIINYVGGIIRVPSIYDVAENAQQIYAFVNMVMTAGTKGCGWLVTLTPQQQLDLVRNVSGDEPKWHPIVWRFSDEY